ncbi:MAG: NYN domain-containing protein [Synechococcales bacterium]|nr:NYN domain-containing protein [Synechococcales bacterium]
MTLALLQPAQDRSIPHPPTQHSSLSRTAWVAYADQLTIAATVVTTGLSVFFQQAAITALVPASLSILLLRQKIQQQQAQQEKLQDTLQILLREQFHHDLQEEHERCQAAIAELRKEQHRIYIHLDSQVRYLARQQQRIPIMQDRLSRLGHVSQKLTLLETSLKTLENQQSQLQTHLTQRYSPSTGIISTLPALPPAEPLDPIPESRAIPLLQETYQRQPERPANTRLAIFVDAANINHGSYTAKMHPIDYAQLLQKLQENAILFRATYYKGIHTGHYTNERQLAKLCPLGYTLVSKKAVRQGDTSKANLDTELVADALTQAWNDSFDTAVLVSGDGDFVDLVKRLQQLGKRVEVVSFPRNTSRLLKKAADSYLDIRTLFT